MPFYPAALLHYVWPEHRLALPWQTIPQNLWLSDTQTWHAALRSPDFSADMLARPQCWDKMAVIELDYLWPAVQFPYTPRPKGQHGMINYLDPRPWTLSCLEDMHCDALVLCLLVICDAVDAIDAAPSL